MRLGAGVKLSIFAAAGEHRYDGTSWILSAGLAMTMLGLAVTQLFAGTVVVAADVVLPLGTAAGSCWLHLQQTEAPTRMVLFARAAPDVRR